MTANRIVSISTIMLLLFWVTSGCAIQHESKGDQAPESLSATIDALVLPHAEAGLASGIILIVRGDQVLVEQTYGLADWELDVPHSPTTRFGLASITKPMTEVLVHLLVSEGSIDLDEPVETYLPGFPMGPDGGVVSVRHLLTHQSGVPHRVTDPVDEFQFLSPADIVERVRNTGLLFEPGSRRLYSSAGFTCLARVIEVVEGRAFETILTERVFQPADMSGAINETGRRLMPRRAKPYGLGAADQRIVVKSAPDKDLRFLTGAGSVYATARDLVNLIRAVESGVFGTDLAELAFGGDPTAWHSWVGRTNGYEAFLDVLPSEELVFVFLSNLQSATNWQLRERIQDILTGQTASPIPFPPQPAGQFEDPESLVGSFGSAEITFVDGQLFRGDNEFYPIDDRRYYIPASGTIMRFRRDSEGVVNAIITIGGSGQESVLQKTGGSF